MAKEWKATNIGASKQRTPRAETKHTGQLSISSSVANTLQSRRWRTRFSLQQSGKRENVRMRTPATGRAADHLTGCDIAMGHVRKAHHHSSFAIVSVIMPLSSSLYRSSLSAVVSFPHSFSPLSCPMVVGWVCVSIGCGEIEYRWIDIRCL